jgi:hypothetical protein
MLLWPQAVMAVLEYPHLLLALVYPELAVAVAVAVQQVGLLLLVVVLEAAAVQLETLEPLTQAAVLALVVQMVEMAQLAVQA